MADLMVTIQEVWLKYYPIVVAGIIGVGTFVAGAYILYTKAILIIQPILDKIQEFREKDEAIATDASILEQVKIDILKADLLAKIDSSAISDELTMVYQAQLDKLNEITTSVVDKVDTIEEITSKYT